MYIARILTALAFASAGGLAHAQISSTIAAVSDYEFRGVSLTDTDPALQASLDYSFSNGIAIGAWGSNLDYGPDYDGDFELDVAEMIEAPKPIKCPHCKAKLDTKSSEDFSTVLEDLIAQVAAMSKKFSLTLTLESDDLPGAYAKDEDDEDD